LCLFTEINSGKDGQGTLGEQKVGLFSIL